MSRTVFHAPEASFVRKEALKLHREIAPKDISAKKEAHHPNPSVSETVLLSVLYVCQQFSR